MAFKQSPQILIGLMLRFWEGLSRILTLACFIRSKASYDVCLESLSCWNTTYVRVLTIYLLMWVGVSRCSSLFHSHYVMYQHRWHDATTVILGSWYSFKWFESLTIRPQNIPLVTVVNLCLI